MVLSHIALINRPAQAGAASEGEASDSNVEWYPEGRLILWCALIALALMTITVLVIGGSAAGFQIAIDNGLERFLENMSQTISAAELEQIRPVVAVMSQFAAQITASVWLLATLFNFWIGSRILTASSRSPRPWAPFGSYALPRSALGALAASCLLAFMPGTLGLIGSIGLSLMTTTFAIIGMAALHGLTMGNPMRVFILSSVYLILLVFIWIIILPLVLLGLADLLWDLRGKRAAMAAGNDE